MTRLINPYIAVVSLIAASNHRTAVARAFGRPLPLDDVVARTPLRGQRKQLRSKSFEDMSLVIRQRRSVDQEAASVGGSFISDQSYDVACW